MSYPVALSAPARRALGRNLPERIAAAAHEFIAGPLAGDPHRVGKPIRPPLAPLWSARRGDYRVVYDIDDVRQVVTVVAVDHRCAIYRS